MTKESFVAEIKMYLRHVADAHNYFVAYKTLANCINSDEFNPKINLAPAFFSVTVYALFDALQLELSKLYCDTDSNEKSLNKLIRKIESNVKLFTTEFGYCENRCSEKYYDINKYIKDIKASLEELKVNINKLTVRRDKRIAHNDKKYFLSPRKVYVDCPLTMDDLYNLICFSGDFCNNLLLYLNSTTVNYKSNHTEDLKQLLDVCVNNNYHKRLIDKAIKEKITNDQL